MHRHTFFVTFENTTQCDQIVANVIKGWREHGTAEMARDQCSDCLLTWSFVTVTDSSCKANVSELQVRWKSPYSTVMYSFTTLQVDVKIQFLDDASFQF